VVAPRPWVAPSSSFRASRIGEVKVSERERLQAELDLAEMLLRVESGQLQELEEKRCMLANGIAGLEAPSELWARYLQEVDEAIAAGRERIAELATLRDETLKQLHGVQ
jgi:hypothetical protein